ncbi:hypothetical protein [Streptomyces sp. NPDC049585]|uniref:WD40 repeat domain-containing protein n=1 Tax=Streptomyces sp. NPDC049585 TaxID=3155154 RepID=UPI003437AD73
MTAPVTDQPIARLSFHPSHVLAIAGKDGRIRLWDTTASQPAAHPRLLPHGPDDAVVVAFSPDGSRLVAAGHSGELTLWDTTKDPLHPALLTTWQSPHATIDDLAVSRDGHTAAALGHDHTVTVWNLDAPQHPEPHQLPRKNQAFDRIALSADGRTLALAEYSPNCEVWIAHLGPDRESTEPGHLFDSVSTVTSLALSADGTRLAVGHIDNGVHLWNVRERWHATDLPQTDGTVGVAFGPDSSSLTVGTRTGGNALWHLPAHLTGHTASITALKTSLDRKLAVTTSQDKTAGIWRLDSYREPPLVHKLACEDHALRSAAFSRDSRTLALTTYAETSKAAVCLWDISNPADPHQIDHWTPQVGGNDINAAAFSRDGRTLVTGGNDGQTIFWDITTPGHHRELTRRGDGHTFDDVVALTVLPNSSALVIGTTRQGAQLWDLHNPREPRRLRKLPGAVKVASLAVSDKGLLAIGTYDDHNVYLWDASDPRQPTPLPTLSGHTTPIWTADLTPDGARLLTTSGDKGGPLRIWNLRAPHYPQLDAVLHGTIGVSAFAPEADSLIAATGDKTLNSWNTNARTAAKILCARAGTPMTANELNLYHGADGPATPCH